MKLFVKESGNFQNKMFKLSKKDLKLYKLALKKINIFRKNPNTKILKNHKLSKKMQGKWAFSVTDDIRIVYKKINKNTVRFLAIGNHKQVYR